VKTCKRCLAVGHSVRDCRSLIWCWWCFNYGHIQCTCFRRREAVRSKWSPKGKNLADAIALEPHPDATDVTHGKTDTEPPLCLTTSSFFAHARGPSLRQSNYKTQVIWKERGSLLCYSLAFPLLRASRGCWRCLLPLAVPAGPADASE
jgi:hypothetical protein